MPSAPSDADPSAPVRLCPACFAPQPTGEHCEECRAPLLVGRRFEVHRVLSSHGAAHTLAGIDAEADADEDRGVIVKTLGIAGLDDWKRLDLFRRGITVLRGIDHPGIPEHLADGQFTRGGQTYHYWVQRRLEGRSLAEGLEQGRRWTEADARRLARSVLEILAYLQGFSPPIMHRDIKPSNVFERSDGSFALIDFDLVKDTLDPDGGATTALGTAGYAPLEQLMGKAVPASDLYGLGATLVAVLSRKSPADLLDSDAGRIAFREHVRVSEAFAELIERLTEPRVGDRPADAQRALRLLHASEPARHPRSRRPSAESESESEPESESETESESESESMMEVQALAVPSGEPVALTVVAPPGKAVVRIDHPLIEVHGAPRWIAPARLGLTLAAIWFVPVHGWIAAVVGLVTWVITGQVLRYPVTLSPGRALFKGGLSNTDVPGRYWLRRRWTETAHSISTEILRLHWQPAPTALDLEAGGRVWLELALELWVRPREDEVGQFFALLNYRGWQGSHSRLASALREEVLDAMVEQLRVGPYIERARRAPVRITENLRALLEPGLRDLGLVLVEIGAHSLTLAARTDDLTDRDRVQLGRADPP